MKTSLIKIETAEKSSQIVPVYFNSALIAKFYLNEPGREAIRSLARDAGIVVTFSCSAPAPASVSKGSAPSGNDAQRPYLRILPAAPLCRFQKSVGITESSKKISANPSHRTGIDDVPIPVLNRNYLRRSSGSACSGEPALRIPEQCDSTGFSLHPERGLPLWTSASQNTAYE